MVSKIGILGIEKLIEVKRPFGNVVLLPSIDVFVDSRDANLRRTIHRAIEDAMKTEITGIEDFSAKIVGSIMEKSKVLRAEVMMKADYAVYRHTPISKQNTQEMYKIIARAIGEKGKIKKMIGAEVVGMTTCPCAQEGLMEYAKKKIKAEIFNPIPIASHNQRNISQLLVEVPEGHKIEAEDLIKIVEESLSSPIYEVLKREDEVEVVLKSHNNPNFVEDVVRKILVKTVEKFKSLPDETMVFARSESIESIHQHNAVAERISFLRELRKETNENLAQKSQRRKNNGGARKPGRSLVLERDHSPR